MRCHDSEYFQMKAKYLASVQRTQRKITENTKHTKLFLETPVELNENEAPKPTRNAEKHDESETAA